MGLVMVRITIMCIIITKPMMEAGCLSLRRERAAALKLDCCMHSHLVACSWQHSARRLCSMRSQTLPHPAQPLHQLPAILRSASAILGQPAAAKVSWKAPQHCCSLRSNQLHIMISD